MWSNNNKREIWIRREGPIFFFGKFYLFLFFSLSTICGKFFLLVQIFEQIPNFFLSYICMWNFSHPTLKICAHHKSSLFLHRKENLTLVKILFFWERKENLTFHLFCVSIENLTLFMESRERNLTYICKWEKLIFSLNYIIIKIKKKEWRNSNEWKTNIQNETCRLSDGARF